MDLLKKLFKGDRIVWIVFMLFCLISIIEVFSASSTLTYKSGDHWRPITSHITLLFTGFIIVFFTHLMPCRWFKKFNIILLVSWAFLLFLLFWGAFTNGARRWIDLGFFQFQPSELAKMGTIIFVAYTLTKFQNENGADKRAFKYIIGTTLFTICLIFTENLSTAALIAATVYIMMFIGRVPWKQMAYITGIGLGVIILALATIKFVPWEEMGIHRFSTWKARIDDHLNHGEIPAAKFDIDNDAQVAHANIAIATSNIVGKGPGNSVQRDFLSQAFSDFIYAIIIEELGLLGGAFVALLYIVLLLRIGKIARESNDLYYSLLIMGIGIIISLQAMFNMLVAVGIIPVTGQPLPLISKGGTSILINSAYIGIILSISRYVYETQAKEEEERVLKETQLHDNAVAILRDTAMQLAEKKLQEENKNKEI